MRSSVGVGVTRGVISSGSTDPCARTLPRARAPKANASVKKRMSTCVYGVGDGRSDERALVGGRPGASGVFWCQRAVLSCRESAAANAGRLCLGWSGACTYCANRHTPIVVTSP